MNCLVLFDDFHLEINKDINRDIVTKSGKDFDYILVLYFDSFSDIILKSYIMIFTDKCTSARYESTKYEDTFNNCVIELIARCTNNKITDFDLKYLTDLIKVFFENKIRKYI